MSVPARAPRFSLLALLAALSLTAQATPYVEASSSSLAQNGPQPVTSSAKIVNGVASPADNVAGPSGSSSTGGGATSAWADTMQPASPALATAYAAADLARGNLRVYAEASLGTTSAIGAARWVDTVTFDNGSGHNVELEFFWNTEGAITALDGNSWRTVNSSIVLSKNNQHFSWIGMKAADGNYVDHLGGAQYQYYGSSISPIGGSFFTFQPAGNNDDGAWRTSLGTGESGVIAATLIIPPGLASIDIDARLQVDCRSGAVCDFGHTSTFAFGALPSGLSWTSESGVFLTAVPEPAAWMLTASGLLLLAAVRRGSGRRVSDQA